MSRGNARNQALREERAVITKDIIKIYDSKYQINDIKHMLNNEFWSMRLKPEEMKFLVIFCPKNIGQTFLHQKRIYHRRLFNLPLW